MLSLTLPAQRTVWQRESYMGVSGNAVYYWYAY